jgi:Tol biopolymer transport system component
LDDQLTECNETFEVSLFNPGGGARLLGSSQAHLTIVENDLLESGAAEAVSVTPGYPSTTCLDGAYGASLSGDGRFVAFVSISSDLVTNNPGSGSDVFVRDLAMGTTKWVSANAHGAASGASDSANPVISADGACVAFDSSVPDLVDNDTNGWSKDVFVRDLATGITRLVSLNTNGTAGGNCDSREPALSSNGLAVAFLSRATDIGTPANTNQFDQVFVRDRAAGVTHLVSVNRFGTGGGNAHAFQPVISADGRFVAFVTAASDLVANDTNGVWDVFVRDLTHNTTTLASVNIAGIGTGDGSSSEPQISADGRFVVFTSWASNLVVGDTNGVNDVFVRDRAAGTTHLLSFNRSGTGGDALSAVLSPDGRYVAFASDAPDLISGDTNGLADVFIRDLVGETTTLVSVNCDGSGSGNGASHPGAVSADGRYVTFVSDAMDLTPGDYPVDQFQSARRNLFVRDRLTGVTTLVSRSIFNGGGAIADSFRPVISRDGQLVVFESGAWDLVAEDRNADTDVFAWRSGSPPVLSIACSNDLVLVSWPSLSPGYRLETSNDLTSPDSWEPVDVISNDGTRKSRAFVTTMDDAPHFFRLRRH